MQDTITRRLLITTIGATTTLSTAGCTSNSDENPITNAEDSDQTKEGDDKSTQQTDTSSFFNEVSISDNGDVVELTVDTYAIEEDVFEVALVSDNGELIESNPIVGGEDTVTYLLARSGRATNGTNHLQALNSNGDIVNEREIDLTYGLQVNDVSVSNEQILNDDGTQNQWVFTFENTGNSAVQLSRFFVTKDAASEIPLTYPINFDNSGRIYINEPLKYSTSFHSLEVGEDPDPLQEAIDSDELIEIPIRVSLNNDNEIYEFRITADVNGEVVKNPAENSYANDTYYPSEFSLEISAQPTLVK